ncbi:MAG: flavin reductase family protein [bacterium]
MTDPRIRTAPEFIDEALRLIPAPVAVIGAARDGVLGGLTAAWVTRVSLVPPLLMVAVGRERFTYGLLRDAPEFTVSLLHQDQVETARLFGLVSGRDRDKWAEVDHDLLGEGSPALRRCSARFLCLTEAVVPAGDHDLFIGRIEQAEILAGAPALPMRGADYAPRTTG